MIVWPFESNTNEGRNGTVSLSWKPITPCNTTRYIRIHTSKRLREEFVNTTCSFVPASLERGDMLSQPLSENTGSSTSLQQVAGQL